MNSIDYMSGLSSLVHRGQALIIVPPFANLDRPSLAAHILQACARQVGFDVSVLYANILLASAIGVRNYVLFAEPRGDVTIMALLGERFFARSAHDLEPLGNWADRMLDTGMIFGDEAAGRIGARPVGINQSYFDIEYLKQLEQTLPAWTDAVADAVTQMSFQVVGCTNTFEQTNASIALLKHVKRRRPQTVTVIGGANCLGEMAEGLALLDPQVECVNYIFSGESEETFPKFLQDLSSGQLSSHRIIYGQPCKDLDALPIPDFSEYFAQSNYYLADVPELIDNTWLSYETSRGCWWGQKRKCTFCGLSDESKRFRQKSPDQVIHELRTLVETYSTSRVSLTDNIMPHSYFKTLLPKIIDELPPLKMWYEQKANLSLDKVLLLKKSGISSIQPGIESLSTSLLRRMNKGVNARQNIMLLRYARSAGLHLMWNLLWGFPGDELESYQETLDLLPLIHHLQPPDRFYHIWIDRFSPYFEHPEQFGVSNLKPPGSYAAVLPPHADVSKIAHRFMADYACASRQNPDIIEEIAQQVAAWKQKWASGTRSTAVLLVARSDQGCLLIDRRGLSGTQEVQPLSQAQALAALVARPYSDSEEIAWALENKVGVVLDSWYVPLTTAKPELLLEFESDS